ncbi:MAG: dihydrolipoamide acetyltransferase family protein [Chloroflexi bacterium]|nr:dihydrolipoamide acetyltransferase family protein [Chloroflexota bacterium]
MATELTMPQMGYDMQEGTVLRWLKGEGDAVANGEPIAEIETDKAVVEFESYADGVLHRIIVPAGTTVPVGEPIAVVGAQDDYIVAADEPDDDIADDSPDEGEAESGNEPESAQSAAIPMPPASSAPVEEEPSPEPVQEDEQPAPPSIPLRASPIARRIAEERGIDISKVQGTGPGGRIVKDDVLSYEEPVIEEPEVVEEPEPEIEEPVAEVEAAPEVEEAAEVEPETVEEQSAAELEPEPEPESIAAPADGMPLSRMRQQIARVTVRSKQEKPHFYVTSEVDMTEAMSLRQQINRSLESEGVRVTVNDLIIKACADALKRHPKFNAFLDGDVIRPNDNINIGIAMAVEEGLLMPAIMGCESMTLKSLALASKDLADRAQNGALRPDEYTGGTFGISNLGMFDVSTFVAIILPPQSAILAVGTVAKRPVVRDDEIVVRQTMNATISADHRVVDGAEGAQFLIDVKESLESPLSLIL